MNKLETYLSILAMVLPIIGCVILLWSDVQTIKVTKADYREVAELKTEMIGQLSKNTEAIDNLNQLIKMMLEERRNSNVK